MSEFKENIKRTLLVKYTEAKLKECSKNMSKSVPWIQKQTLMNTIETHCKILLNAISGNEEKQSFRDNKYMIDSIFKYTLKRSEDLLKTKKRIKDIKSYMRLNSYIVFEEIAKGKLNNQSNKTITFNIEKHLAELGESTDSKTSPDEILERLCGCEA